MKKFLFKKKIEILQKIADFIIDNLKKSKSDRIFNYWLFIGYVYNEWCIERKIYLN